MRRMTYRGHLVVEVITNSQLTLYVIPHTIIPHQLDRVGQVYIVLCPTWMLINYPRHQHTQSGLKYRGAITMVTKKRHKPLITALIPSTLAIPIPLPPYSLPVSHQPYPGGLWDLPHTAWCRPIRVQGSVLQSGTVIVIITSLNWSHNGSKNYTIDSVSRNRCQWPLTNYHTDETAGK